GWKHRHVDGRFRTYTPACLARECLQPLAEIRPRPIRAIKVVSELLHHAFQPYDARRRRAGAWDNMGHANIDVTHVVYPARTGGKRGYMGVTQAVEAVTKCRSKCRERRDKEISLNRSATNGTTLRQTKKA